MKARKNKNIEKQKYGNTLASLCRRNGGFTLFETLIYIAIIGAVVVAFVNFILSVSGSRSKTYVVQEVQSNVRMAVDLITRKIQASNGINIASSTFSTDPGYLSLSMASSTLNPTIFSLDQNDGVLRIKEGGLATSSVTSNKVKITNLVFTNLTSSSTRENIRIEMTAEYDASNSDVEYRYSQSLQTAASVRQ